MPDVCQILTRRGGIFTSPVTATAKAKLRALYKVIPIAFLIESGGGAAVDERGKRVLDRTVQGMDERMGLSCGEKGLVERFVNVVYGCASN